MSTVYAFPGNGDPLPLDIPEPLVYLSAAQKETVDRSCPSLRDVALPAWVPQRLVAKDLGFSDEGVRKGLEHTDGENYVWATEFENVHMFWTFEEPKIEVADNEQVWQSAEHWYQSCKPQPFDNERWKLARDDVMRQGLRGKLHASPEVRDLLLKTGSHPLVSLKNDKYWGVHPTKGGRNRLGEMWMELRAELHENERKRKHDADAAAAATAAAQALFGPDDDDPPPPAASMCVVCTVTPSNYILLPCAHLCLCHNCIGRALEPDDLGEVRCPICRKDVTNRLRIFAS